MANKVVRLWVRLNGKLKRFLTATVVSFVIAGIWPVALVVNSWECHDHALRWIKHHLTFSVVHHTFFPVAIGVFFATIQWKSHRRSKAVLYILVTLMAVGLWFDFFSPPMEPYMLRDPCAGFATEMAIRQQESNLSGMEQAMERRGVGKKSAEYLTALDEYEHEVDAYAALSWRKSRSPAGVAELGSVVAWITFAQNLYFGLFITAYFWFTVTVLGPWNERRDLGLYCPGSA